jgi:hypothetical protein
VIPETREGRRLAMARHRGRPAARVPRGIPVRVIEADITITPAAGPPRTGYYRLITTLHDTARAPALAIARTYAMRWHSEIGHRWYRSSCAAFSWWRSFVVAGFRFLRCPAGAAVEARRACPAFA